MNAFVAGFASEVEKLAASKSVGGLLDEIQRIGDALKGSLSDHAYHSGFAITDRAHVMKNLLAKEQTRAALKGGAIGTAAGGALGYGLGLGRGRRSRDKRE